MAKWLLWLIVGGACLGVVASAQRTKVLRVDLCKLVSDPGPYVGRLIEFSANFESDGIEHTILVDPSCDAKGIVPMSEEHFAGERELDRALQTGHPGTLDKRIHGTFVGRFAWDANKMPVRSLALLAVKNVTVALKSKP